MVSLSRTIAVLFVTAALTGCGLLAKPAADVEEFVEEDDVLVDLDAEAADSEAKDLYFDVKDTSFDAKDTSADVKDVYFDVKDVSAEAKDQSSDAEDMDSDEKDQSADVEDAYVDVGPPICTPAQVAACDDGNFCTDDTCDFVFGCNHIYSSAPCDDGSACTGGDACSDGACVGSDLSCDDGKACTTDSCKPAFGCIHSNSSQPCDDGNICTVGEACKVGACIGGSAADCSDGIACTLDTCDPASGCQHSSGDGPCDDGSYCTIGEVCTGGVCAGGSPALCNDGNECTNDGCDPPSGCTFTDLNGGCDDGNPCSAYDSCALGACKGVPLVCVPADLCHSAGICEAKTGSCSPVNAPDGSKCDDGKSCTTEDTCLSGACVGANQCDDADVCTLDACLPSGACSHTTACTVGGTVSGLIGGGLTIVSGGHVAGVNQDGAFTLSGGFANGAGYFATLLAVPQTPPQHCAVRNGSGNIHGGNVSDLVVTCGACGDGAVTTDPVVALDVDWLGNTQTPAPEFMTCSVNGTQFLHVDSATAQWYCDTLPFHVQVVDAAALAALQAGKNALSCNFAQNLAWLVVTARHASGRAEATVVYDYPGDTGGTTDAIRRNSACPGFDTPGSVNGALTISFTEACDDGNLDDGDGCSSLCLAEDCTPGADGDADGLDDCYETATGSYLDATHAGTSPLLWDTDGDGLSDGDELLGTKGGLDLAALGADPLRADVFVEADWMVDGAECQQHSHQVTPTMAAMAVQMFANAPRQNPDGTSGIALHIDSGQGGPWTGGNNAGNEVEFPPDIGVDFANVKAGHFAANRLGYFHYALMMHSLGPTAGGIGELTGDDFIVASGGCDACYTCKGTPILGHLAIEAFCHELGHNLGLGHGGDSSCNGKANYPSIMNYRHAYFGIDVDCDDLPDDALDYSRGDRVLLNENALDEANGVCGGFWIDWNMDGNVTASVKKDLNGGFNNTCDGGVFALSTDHDDWGHLAFSGVTSGVAAAASSGRKPEVCYDDPASVAKRQRRN